MRSLARLAIRSLVRRASPCRARPPGYNDGMWARIHKLGRVRPTANGGAIVVLEDERSTAQVQRIPSLSTLVAIARVLAARRALELKFDGKGEVRYAAGATLPPAISEAITAAGAAITDSTGDRVIVPARPSGVAALIDIAFSELAHNVRGHLGVSDLSAALKQTEDRRRASPLDRDREPEKYWPAVLELASLAGELSRPRGARWIETRDLPVPFAMKFPDGAISHPTVVAQAIIEGNPPSEPPAT